MYTVFKTTVGNKGMYYSFASTTSDPEDFRSHILSIRKHNLRTERRITMAILDTPAEEVSTKVVDQFEEREDAGRFKSKLILEAGKQCLNVQLYKGEEGQGGGSSSTYQVMTSVFTHIEIPDLDPVDLLQIGHRYYIRPDAVEKYEDVDSFVSDVSFYKGGEWYEFYSNVVIDNYLGQDA